MSDAGVGEDDGVPFVPPPYDPMRFARVAAIFEERPRVLNALQRKRIAAGLSQDELAVAVGVSRQTISAIENRRTTPSVQLALAIAAELGASVEELFPRDEPREDRGQATR